MYVLLLLFLSICVASPLHIDKLISPSSKLHERGLAWDYQNDKIRGVNLGGWFVLEPFITPSLFQEFSSSSSGIPVDEYHFCQQLGKDACLEKLQSHWSSWIVESDFQQIQQAGLNTVRIPIGYWAFQLLDNDPYVQGQTTYLNQALEWCRQYNLKAWVDLHGAPGSQNGFDNSGLRDTVGFQSGDNTQFTLNVLQQMMETYGGDDYADVVIGIELLNEPLGPALNLDDLKSFYQNGYSQLRNTAGNSQACIIHDAFQSSGYWNNELTTSGNAWNVVVDHHHYQVFSAGELERSIEEHISVACKQGYGSTQESHWNVVGEWTASLTDCALWLNGVGRGARYSGDYDNSPYMDSCSSYLNYDTWTDTYKTNVRKYVEAQMDAYEMSAGWIFWTWKTESAVEWDFSRLLAEGFIPSPLTSRQYPGQCFYG